MEGHKVGEEQGLEDRIDAIANLPREGGAVARSTSGGLRPDAVLEAMRIERLAEADPNFRKVIESFLRHCR